MRVVYRSPNSPDQNNMNLLTILRIAKTANCSQLVCGEFNLLLMNWNSWLSSDTEISFTSRFLSAAEDLNLYQQVKTYTRFRNNQHSCLDLVFTSEENMVNEVMELPPIGKSDHVCQQWGVVVEEVMYINTMATRYNFKRANWDSVKAGLSNFRFDQADSPTTMNNKLVECIKDLKAKTFRSAKQVHTVPPSMDAKCRVESPESGKVEVEKVQGVGTSERLTPTRWSGTD